MDKKHQTKIINEIQNLWNDDEKETEKVRNWLKESVRLEQYHSNFIDNGYDTLRFVKTIKKISELEDVGIMLKGHQHSAWVRTKVVRNLIQTLRPL